MTVSKNKKYFLFLFIFAQPSFSLPAVFDLSDLNPSELFKQKTYVQNSSPKKINPRGFIEPLFSPENKAWMGTATRICIENYVNTAQSSRTNYYISAAHIFNENTSPILSNGESLKIKMRDDGLDLVLFSGPASYKPCLNLAESITVEKSFDVEAVLPTQNRKITIEVEVPNASDPKNLESYSMETLMTVSMTDGLPGRDEMGNVLSVIAHGARGHSGGAIMSFASEEEGISEKTQTIYSINSEADKDTRRRLIGMILAVDREGRQMAALPATTILSRLRNYFINGKISLERPDRRRLEGGTLYYDSGAIHHRSWIQEASTPNLVDSGTGGLVDGGTSSLADRDWNYNNKRAQKFSSGISLEDKRWLEIKDRWTEYEAIHQQVKEDLLRPSLLEGIYEKNGFLFSRGRSFDLASWLEISGPSVNMPFLFDNSTQFEKFKKERELKRAVKKDANPCYKTVGGQRMYMGDIINLVLVTVCEEDFINKRQIRIRAHLDSGKEINFYAGLERRPSDGDDEVILQASYLKKDSTVLAANDFSRSLDSEWSYMQKNQYNNGFPLKNDGLRAFKDGKNFLAILNRFGGYRFEFLDSGVKWVIVGPISMTKEPPAVNLLKLKAD